MLQLVQLGPTDDEVEKLLYGPSSQASVAPRAVHEADEGGPPSGDQGGDAEGPVLGNAALVLAPIGLRRSSAGHLVEDGVGVDIVADEDLA